MSNLGSWLATKGTPVAHVTRKSRMLHECYPYLGEAQRDELVDECLRALAMRATSGVSALDTIVGVVEKASESGVIFMSEASRRQLCWALCRAYGSK